MNVPFTLADASLDKRFLEEAEAEQLLNLKGTARLVVCEPVSTMRLSNRPLMLCVISCIVSKQNTDRDDRSWRLMIN